MAGNSFGQLFRVTTAGESHGPGQLAIIDGLPAGLELSVDDLLPDLRRRRPGQSALVTQRQEEDLPEILSGLFEGRTTGAPLSILIRNTDARSKDYESLRDTFRPGHADYTWQSRFGRRDHRGGGRSSARETVARVAAGAVARKLLATAGIAVLGWVDSVGGITLPASGEDMYTREEVEASPTRCPHPETAGRMTELIETCREEGDSIGGTAVITATGLPPGLGEPVFDKLRADLAKGLCSLPAVMGVEFGAGFSAAEARGSAFQDAIEHAGPEGLRTRSNRHGGLLGGLSSGMPLRLRCAVKPTSSIPMAQQGAGSDGSPKEVCVTGRHDPCLLPRFVPIAEAMVLLVLADHWLRARSAAL